MLGQTVLLISPQPGLRRQLRVVLNKHGARLLECRRADEQVELLLSQDLILLDVSAHESTAADATRLIREHSDAPLIALVATNDEQQQRAVLDAGADDCLVVPLPSGEMLARMHALLERTKSVATVTPPDVFRAGALEVDFIAREVRLHSKPIHLTPTEYKLLRVLIESAGKVVPHDQLVREVWGPAAIEKVQSLRISMRQLRRKFDLAPAFAHFRVTEAAGGYRLRVPRTIPNRLRSGPAKEP